MLPQEETLVAKKKKLMWIKRRNLGAEKDNWVIFPMSEFGKVMTGAGEGTNENRRHSQSEPKERISPARCEIS